MLKLFEQCKEILTQSNSVLEVPHVWVYLSQGKLELHNYPERRQTTVRRYKQTVELDKAYIEHNNFVK